jgi:hypothetical protein
MSLILAETIILIPISGSTLVNFFQKVCPSNSGSLTSWVHPSSSYIQGISLSQYFPSSLVNVNEGCGSYRSCHGLRHYPRIWLKALDKPTESTSRRYSTHKREHDPTTFQIYSRTLSTQQWRSASHTSTADAITSRVRREENISHRYHSLLG